MGISMEKYFLQILYSEKTDVRYFTTIHHSVLIPKISDSFSEKCWKYVYDVKSHAYPKGVVLQMKSHLIKLARSCGYNLLEVKKQLSQDLSLFLFPYFLHIGSTYHSLPFLQHSVLLFFLNSILHSYLPPFV